MLNLTSMIRVKHRRTNKFGLEAIQTIQRLDKGRPKSIRAYDQIPMLPGDLLSQVFSIAPQLANKRVLFMGDHDSTSLLIGALGSQGLIDLPKKMMLLDFDQRLLDWARIVSVEYGFEDILDCRLYNVFDPIPSHIVGNFDWFYTNPPYGCRNKGESARLFVARCLELMSDGESCGCIILPDDSNRPWTRSAMLQTQKFLYDHNWAVDEKVNGLHRYRLDDDCNLKSSMLIAKRCLDVDANKLSPYNSYFSRAVEFNEIPFFYGLSVLPPYPRYIMRDGSYCYDWS